MNQLTGKYVNVVLSVECGRGMEFLRNKVFITANFNNRILESDHIPPEESPPFNTELVWEIEKKELRKIRCGNLPLRVECITVDSQSRKERIGFTLLSLRSAQIIPQSIAHQPVVPVWQKLIGCQADKRKSHPELYLSLTLRDHLLTEQINIDCNNGAMPFIIEEENQIHEEIVTPKECAIKYFENGHIQIGDEHVAKIPFSFNLKILDVFNLDTLLPESLVFQANSGSYFLTFKILGIIIKTKPFQNQMCGNITLNERIVVNLLSTKDILEKFFKTQVISISFFYGYDKLGVTKLNFNNVWEKKEEQQFFKFPTPDGVVPHGCTEKSPYISIETWIEENEEIKVQEPEISRCDEIPEKPKARSIFSNVCKKSGNDIDIKSTHNTEEPEKLPKPKTIEKVILPTVTKSIDTVIISESTSARPSAILDVYEKFVILVSLKYIMWSEALPDTKIMFKFLHPKAGSCTTIFTEVSNEVKKEIALNNIYVRIAYISTAENITRLLKYWHPKLVIADKNEEYITDQQIINLTCLENKSKDIEIEFKSLKTASSLATIGLNVNLNIVDSRLEDDYESLYLLPVILDEILTINEVSDLDKWKENQKIEFQLELNNIKERETSRLEMEYEEKKVALDSKVSKILNKCKSIQEQLKKKMLSMKFEKDFMKKEGSKQDLYEDIFTENWASYSNGNTKDIIELLSKTQRDNIILKEICEEQKEELSVVAKSSFTKAQTSTILQELKTLEDKFSEARAAKRFFKEQWHKACDKIHDLKTEDKQNTETKVYQSNEEKSSTLTLAKYPGFYTEQIPLEDVPTGQS